MFCMRIKHTVKILLLFLLFFGLLFWLNQITTPDRVGDAPWEEYYALPDDTLDVLIVGSSKVNHTFNPVVINNALELDAYSLSAHGIGMDESYYALREAFKTQSPKIVALELYSAKPVTENSNDRAPLHRVYDAMRLSPNKTDAILSKVPLKESLEYFIPFTINHSRWKDLSFQDFLLFGEKASYTRFLGYYIVEYNVAPSEFTIPPQDYMDDTTKIMPDSGTMQTLERITDLCKENGAQLVYVVSPGYGEEKFGYADMHRLVNGLTPYAEAEGIAIWITIVCCWMAKCNIKISPTRTIPTHWGRARSAVLSPGISRAVLPIFWRDALRIGISRRWQRSMRRFLRRCKKGKKNSDNRLKICIY